MAAHQSKSKHINTWCQEVSIHLYNCGKGFNIVCLFKALIENNLQLYSHPSSYLTHRGKKCVLSFDFLYLPKSSSSQEWLEEPRAGLRK